MYKQQKPNTAIVVIGALFAGIMTFYFADLGEMYFAVGNAFACGSLATHAKHDLED